jgi:hypothetical protein
MDAALRDELLAMEAEDIRVRAELLEEGTLGDGYNPRMRAVHERNAMRLKQIIGAHGWPGRSLVGRDGSHAAWRIVQHTIGEPDFQRSCVSAIEKSIAEGEAPLAQLAFLVDRVRYFEGKPRFYGAQSDWDENGELNAERTREIREQAAREGDNGPKDREEHKRKFEAWLRETGWRK